uniref:Uncharacterized protein n=1 Tax=virus sp. ctoYX9 TaxID=2825822 RepID=A0A8S5RNR3_9VIRU|nr:MAG TPA: hypothetical protein [virus sp. ctoYX9]
MISICDPISLRPIYRAGVCAAVDRHDNRNLWNV